MIQEVEELSEINFPITDMETFEELKEDLINENKRNALVIHDSLYMQYLFIIEEKKTINYPLGYFN